MRNLATRQQKRLHSKALLRRTAIVVAVGTFAALAINLRDTRAEVRRLEEDLARTEEALAETRREKRDIQDELQETERALDEATSENSQLQSEIANLKGDVGDLEGVVTKCEIFASTANEIRALFGQFLLAWAGFLDAFSNSLYYLASSFVDDMTAVVNQLPSAFQRFDAQYGDCSSAVEGIA